MFSRRFTHRITGMGSIRNIFLIGSLAELALCDGPEAYAQAEGSFSCCFPGPR